MTWPPEHPDTRDANAYTSFGAGDEGGVGAEPKKKTSDAPPPTPVGLQRRVAGGGQTFDGENRTGSGKAKRARAARIRKHIIDGGWGK